MLKKFNMWFLWKIVCLAFCFLSFSVIIAIDNELDKLEELKPKYEQLQEEYAQLEIAYDTLANQYIAEIEKIRDMSEEEPEVINLTDIVSPSNLTMYQLDEIVHARLGKLKYPNSKMYNIGNYLVDMEKEHGVNAIFCIAVATYESNYGMSAGAINKNNLFGLMGEDGLMRFNSVEACIDYWGRLLRNNYIDKGLTSIELISTKYCASSEAWVKNIHYFMELYSADVKT